MRVRSIEKYCFRFRRKLDKIFKRFFGCNNFNEAVKEANRLQQFIENMVEKPFESLDDLDLMVFDIGYSYAKYKTLRKFINCYQIVAEIQNFNLEELEEYGKGCGNDSEFD